MINRSFLLKNIPTDWKFIVEKEINKKYFDEIIKEINLSYQKQILQPSPEKIFRAFEKTNSHAIALDELYSKKYRSISNILTVNRKLFDPDILMSFAKDHDCCRIATECNYDVTKVRYYHDKEYYKPHIDTYFQYLSFSYFYKEPKKFSGGELYFPQYDYDYSCENNSMIIFPGWVAHGVTEVSIDKSDYYEGYGRYCISSFFGCEEKK